MNVNKEKVDYVSKLCKIDIGDNFEKYYQEFTAIMESVDKILEAQVDKDVLITPNQSVNRFYERVQNDDITEVFSEVERGYHVFRRWNNE